MSSVMLSLGNFWEWLCLVENTTEDVQGLSTIMHGKYVWMLLRHAALLNENILIQKVSPKCYLIFLT